MTISQSPLLRAVLSFVVGSTALIMILFIASWFGWLFGSAISTNIHFLEPDLIHPIASRWPLTGAFGLIMAFWFVALGGFVIVITKEIGSAILKLFKV